MVIFVNFDAFGFPHSSIVTLNRNFICARTSHRFMWFASILRIWLNKKPFQATFQPRFGYSFDNPANIAAIQLECVQID